MRPSDMTVKQANAIKIPATVIISGGLNSLGPSNGTFVIEKIGESLWRVTKMSKQLPGRVARAMLFLHRHGDLLAVGGDVWSDVPRQRVKGVTVAMLNEAVAFRPRVVSHSAGKFSLTERGRGFFRPQERLVFSVPADMVQEVTEAVERVLDRHNQ